MVRRLRMTCWRSALEDLMRRKCFSSRGITVRLRSVFLRLVACLQVFKDPINTSYARSCIEILGLLFTCIFEGYMGRRTNLLTFLSFTTVMYFGISIRGISTITKEVFVFIASFQSVCQYSHRPLHTPSIQHHCARRLLEFSQPGQALGRSWPPS